MAKNMVCLCSVFSPADPKILSEDTTIYTYDNNCLLLYTLYYFLITIFHFLAFNKAKHSYFDTKLCLWVKLYYLVGKNVSFVSLLWQLFTADICTRRTVYRIVVYTNTVCICAIAPHYLCTLYIRTIFMFWQRNQGQCDPKTICVILHLKTRFISYCKIPTSIEK
jgi:hypothetical protein